MGSRKIHLCGAGSQLLWCSRRFGGWRVLEQKIKLSQETSNGVVSRMMVLLGLRVLINRHVLTNTRSCSVASGRRSPRPPFLMRSSPPMVWPRDRYFPRGCVSLSTPEWLVASMLESCESARACHLVQAKPLWASRAWVNADDSAWLETLISRCWGRLGTQCCLLTAVHSVFHLTSSRQAGQTPSSSTPKAANAGVVP